MVIWSSPAKADLRRIFEFIAQDSRYYAAEVTDQLFDLADSLNSFPGKGRIVPEINNPNIRELLSYSYRIIYQYTALNIHILTIVHMRQKLPKKPFTIH